MKKLLSVLLAMCLCLPCALAGFGDEPLHFTESVVSCAQTSSKYDQFYASGQFSIIIPGLSEDFVPQGLAYYTAGGLVFFTGYSSWGSSSMLLAVDPSTNQVVKEILLALPNGEPYTGHAGGVCVTGQNIFISGENKLYRLPLSDFHAAMPMDVCAFAEAISVPVEASFCQLSDGVLWVGEFNYDKKEYYTDRSHYINSKDSEHKSWIVGYKLASGSANDLNPACMTAGGAVPDYVLSITDRIQGLTFCNGQIYLSQSYGRTNSSVIYRHRNVLSDIPNTYVNVLGAQRPLWILDSTTESGKLTAPPMTEGLCTIAGAVFVSFESAATYYMDPENPSKNPIDRIFRINPSKF